MPSEPRILFRVDAGKNIGTGHLRRCLSIARHLRRRGASVVFATRTSNPTIDHWLSDAGVTQVVLSGLAASRVPHGQPWAPADQEADAEDLLAQSGTPTWDTVVVDHYGLGIPWETALSDHTHRLVVIDDLANRAHHADLLVDHNWYGPNNHKRYKALVPPETPLLLGPRYALLDHSYATTRRSLPVRTPPKRVLVNFGGTDAGAQTTTAIDALLGFPDLLVDAVMGTPEAVEPSVAQRATHPRVALHTNLPSLAPLLSKCDLAIGASGTATWERLCLGVPALVTTVHESQSGVTRALAAAGVTTWLGTASDVTLDDYRSAIAGVLAGNGPSPLPLVDGHGAARVALALLPGSGTDFDAQPPRWDDVATFTTSAPQAQQNTESWRQRHADFVDFMGCAPRDIRLLRRGGVPVGVQYYGHTSSSARWLDPCITLDVTAKG